MLKLDLKSKDFFRLLCQPGRHTIKPSTTHAMEQSLSSDEPSDLDSLAAPISTQEINETIQQ